ncbi:MAG: CoA transferase [Alphaproteobacteria bacterium]|nr:CoA transferase [Alphaproteobacteria bacterium]
MDDQTRRPPLDGIRVLDLSRVLAGPWCTMTLGDLGADVIKLEPPGAGDDTRSWGKRIAGLESTYFLSANRNKRGIAVDLGKPEGAALARALAERADVLVENFKLDGLKKFGLDYEAVRALNPGLVYCSISGYGRTGPAAARAGYDAVIQGESGLMSITGQPEGPALKVGVALSDVMTGMYAVQAILAALIARQQTGRGQHIDLALLDCSMANLANVASSALLLDTVPKRYGNAHADIAPYQTFTASDGDIVVAVGNDGQYRKFCAEVIARPDLAADPRFATNPLRSQNRAALVPEIAAVMKAKPRAWWIERLLKSGVPGGAVRDVKEALGSPEAAARRMVRAVPHPLAGTVKIMGSPLNLSDTPVREPAAPPTLGQHTDAVLREVLGMDAAAIARLRAAGAIA